MSPQEQLFDELNEFDSVEYSRGRPMRSKGTSTAVLPVKGNPSFVSQFDLNIKMFFVRYDTNDPGLGNGVISPNDLPQVLKNKLPFFLFGKADFSGGYLNCFSRSPLSNWVKEAFTIWGGEGGNPDGSLAGDPFTQQNIDAVSGNIGTGDLVYTYSYTDSTSSAAPIFYCAYIIIHCSQVAYGTLLDATSSDRFVMNGIRFVVQDISKIQQYENQLQLVRQSLFGKQSNDFVSPVSYKKPEQFQTNIVDIPIVQGIDKETAILSFLNYDADEIVLSIFVKAQKQVRA